MFGASLCLNILLLHIYYTFCSCNIVLRYSALSFVFVLLPFLVFFSLHFCCGNRQTYILPLAMSTLLIILIIFKMEENFIIMGLYTILNYLLLTSKK